jgi:hypothetical protein
VTNAEIPEEYEGKAVTGIEKKAFLGCKRLQSVSIPGKVAYVGDWAFAGCDLLQTVSISSGGIAFGKGVFERDRAIREIRIKDRGNDTANLLAAAVTVMEADYLLDVSEAGSSAWLERWDTKLADILSRSDDDGYHLYVLCGEEDLHFDYDEYLEYSRRKKAGLCLQRLLYPRGLKKELENRLIGYIADHSPGCESRAAWDHVYREHPDEQCYYELLVRLGSINRGNVEEVLLELGSRHAGVKSWLLGEFGSTGRENDYFDDLML